MTDYIVDPLNLSGYHTVVPLPPNISFQSSGVTVSDEEVMQIYPTGDATNDTAGNDGLIFVGAGGSADNITVDEDGFLDVYGAADNVTINKNGYLDVFSDGSVSNVNFNGGIERIYDGFSVNNVTINSDGLAVLDVGAGCTADGSTVSAGGNIQIETGGSATNTSVTASGEMDVYGTATTQSVTSGTIFVEVGGSVTSTIVNSDSILEVFGTVDSATINSGGIIDLHGGASATGLTFKGGTERIYSGYNVADLTITANTLAKLYVNSGSQADGSQVSDEGYIQIANGGSATNTSINSSGEMDVYGTATSTSVGSAGLQSVYSGGTTENTVIDNGGVEDIDNGSATSTTINNGALLIDENSSDLNIENLTINNGGQIDLINVGYDPNGNYKIESSASGSDATLVVLEDGSNYSIGLSSQSINENFVLSDDGNGGTLITAVPAGLTIDPADKAESYRTALKVGANGSRTVSPVTGTIGFTDTDAYATPTAAFESGRVITVTGPNGSVPLTASEHAALSDPAAFQISGISTMDGGTGSVDWTYKPDAEALSFLIAGETATILSTVDVSDSDGNSDTSTVTIKVTGAGRQTTGTPPTTPTLTLTSLSAAAVPTISGKADAGDTVTLYDGTTSLGKTTADPTTGAFSFTALSALGAGEHDLTAIASDTAGDTSAASLPLVIEVGTAATITAELDALETKPNLSAIVITDARLLPVASVAAMNHLMTADAAALAAIQGGYSFGITNVTSTGTVTSIYNPAGVLTYTSTTQPGGSTTLDSFNASGTLTREATTYADKSQDITKYGITGQSYTTEQDTYNSAGVLTSQIRTHADGTSASSYVLNPDGSSVLDYFNASGILTRQGITHADKSQDITKYSGTSPNLVTEHDVINAQGTQSLVDQTQPNGSHVEYIYTPGQTLVSNTGISDAFDNFSAGSTTFVFNPAFGQDVISGFHAGASANHDVIQIGSATLNQFSDLVGLMTPSGAGGADTLITIDPTDTILLKHVAKASLTAQNFAFTHIA